jgi:hypothetical protein
MCKNGEIMIGNMIYECKTRNNVNAAHSDDVAVR